MKLMDDRDWEMHRFSCRCLGADHCLELHVDKVDNKPTQVTINLYASRGCYGGVWVRFKRAMAYLFQVEPEPWYDTIIRAEDLPEVITILERVRDEQSQKQHVAVAE